MIRCYYCDGPRPVHRETNRCCGCGMPAREATSCPEPPGKRPCPICETDLVHWCEGNTRLKCMACGSVFRPDGRVVR
jgi:hypothetical protein